MSRPESDRLFFRQFPERRYRIRLALPHEVAESAAGATAPAKNLRLCVAVWRSNPFMRMRAFCWFSGETDVEQIDEAVAQEVFSSLSFRMPVAAVNEAVELLVARTPPHIRQQLNETYQWGAGALVAEISDDGLAGGVQ